jgi:hypothetical protein
MRVTGLSHSAEEATRRALAYWVEQWDWECATLFGIERDELSAVLLAWPTILPGTEEHASLAVIGAYRELLHGASAVARSEVEAKIGVTYEQACSLLEQLWVLMKPLRGHVANDG